MDWNKVKNEAMRELAEGLGVKLDEKATKAEMAKALEPALAEAFGKTVEKEVEKRVEVEVPMAIPEIALGIFKMVERKLKQVPALPARKWVTDRRMSLERGEPFEIPEEFRA